MPLQDKLNPQQCEAVQHVSGPVLILAGAGSGKTRVITYRIAHLIEELGIAPDHILAVTFTNKAAAEMAERVQQLVRATLAQAWISTFHSFCVRVLRRDIEAMNVRGQAGGYRKDFVIYDESDQQMVVKAAIRRLGLDDKQITPRAVLSRISHAKNHMLDPQEMFLNSTDPKSEQVAHIFQTYRQELRKSNALDFDDLLLETVRLLQTVPDVRERYARRFEHILVDEYQDTNRPQYELMRLLGSAHQNVCAVGDEDQSIYSWRGADIRNILEFERDFPNAHIVRLEQNYRSTQNILEAASAVVGNNIKRKGKNLWTSRQGGPRIGFYEAPDGENEALFAADYINKYLREAGADGDKQPRAAVLYRTNFQSRLLEEAMRRYQLKYHVVGGFSFYERAEIKDMISYLKVVQNPDDSVALLRTINTPVRGIGKTTVETLERLALETGISLWGAIGEAVERKLLPPRSLAALANFRRIINDARAMLTGTFADHLDETAVDSDAAADESQSAGKWTDTDDDDVQFSFGELAGEGDASDADNAEGGGDTDFVETLLATSSGDSADDSAQSQSPDPFRRGELGMTNSEVGSGPTTTDQRPTTAPPTDDDQPPPSSASTAELLKFLLDRTGYIKSLEQEDTPEAIARIENLRELVNAAMDSRDRDETLTQFLDHAALVSDADQYDENARITLMTLHAAKGLEFPLVFLVGLEEGLFPHSRTLLSADDVEEERRLCYVGMTRAMDALVVSRARYRRRYGTEMPEATVPSRFLEEIPPQLLEDLGSPSPRREPAIPADYRTRYQSTEPQFRYEDEDQSLVGRARPPKPKKAYSGTAYNSIDNIAQFFASRGKKFTPPQIDVAAPEGSRGFRPGQKVRHPKYGEGTVYKREGEGEDAKITVQFPQFGLKKLVEKYAQLKKA